MWSAFPLSRSRCNLNHGFRRRRPKASGSSWTLLACPVRPWPRLCRPSARPAAARRISVVFGYVIAPFSPPADGLPPNEDIKPISDWFAGWPSDAAATTARIVGLGYQRAKAEGACEYFDASETWAYVPQSPLKAYDAVVEHNNKELLQRVKRRDRALTYSVNRPSETFGQLAATVSGLVREANPVLLPFGPKIFFAINLLVAALYRETGVWHVTDDASAPEAIQDASAYSVAFLAELGPIATD